MAEELCTGWFRIVAGSLEIEECKSAIMMEGLKKRTRKAFGIRKKEKDTDSTGSPDRDGSLQKKSNGAPNGFYGEIDWERYNSPEVDEEGYSIRPEELGDSPKAKSHFFSSSESEEEEEHRKKFKIKIKPLPKDNANFTAPSVDELKASIGNIALSPSPLRSSPRRSPGLMKRNASGEEVARPRRSVLTVNPTIASAPEAPSRKVPVPQDATALFGPPLETTFEAQKTEVVIDEPDVWGVPYSESHPDSSLTRPFPHGTPPLLPPKIVPASSLVCGSPITDSSEILEGESEKLPASGSQEALPDATSEKPSMADLDNIFGPIKAPTPKETTTENNWVSFTDESPERPPTPEEPAPPLPTVPPPDSPPCVPHGPPTEEVSDLSPNTGPPAQPSTRSIPPPLVLSEENRRSSEVVQAMEGLAESVASPKELSQGPKATPPPPPPPTYRAVVSSPGPYSGTGSGSSSPARPSTPLSGTSATPPPPPPRPPSRPKLPPGKPSIGDVTRPFSPPIHSSSPPPIAPLARAESTSSISSTNSLSAATTPTVGKELAISVSEDDAFVCKVAASTRRCQSPAENDQPSLVWFDRGKFYLTFEGCSRGPSPLTMGAQDTLPVAAAFTETVNAYFKGADPGKCVVKITGEMVLSFPAGITRHFANNPSPAVLTFSITNYSRLEHVLPNPQLLCCDTPQSSPNSKEFWVNMPNLMIHLKKVAEQKPQATYYNVDMLKYQVSAQGIQATPLNLAVSWRCEPTSTDLRIDYKYNGEAMTTPVALNNVQFLVPVNGGVTKLQAVLPPAAWNAEQQRILWKIPDISQKSENGGVGSLLARFQLTEGPSKPSPLAVQFTSEGSTLSGCDIELVGPGYRFSLIKKRFAAGKYLADN
ncbi:SH3-containing GRB2-like protein 3-interacting protein 1 [Scleropages formosus]|uniref:SH3-containing GRB2-like protein 3-interacting protein 1 n=1 Tax=Scleropages formosus TaxID=113540 RepID=UPI000878BECB|nr:SH3-containing GRB2-like protein 3-interacting protein 1 [Scleropages formosus]